MKYNVKSIFLNRHRRALRCPLTPVLDFALFQLSSFLADNSDRTTIKLRLHCPLTRDGLHHHRRTTTSYLLCLQAHDHYLSSPPTGEVHGKEMLRRTWWPEKKWREVTTRWGRAKSKLPLLLLPRRESRSHAEAPSPRQRPFRFITSQIFKQNKIQLDVGIALRSEEKEKKLRTMKKEKDGLQQRMNVSSFVAKRKRMKHRRGWT